MSERDPFRQAEHVTPCPECETELSWNTEDGLAGQTCGGCGHVFTAQPAYDLTYSGPRVMLDTAVGPVEVKFTEAGHCYVSVNAESGDVQYRGRHWYLSVHLYAATGWSEDSADPEASSYRHDFTEAGTFGRNKAPQTHRAAIVAAIVKAVREYAEANPGTLRDAEANHLYHDYQSAQKDFNAIAEKYHAAEARARELGRALDKVTGNAWRGWDAEPVLPLCARCWHSRQAAERRRQQT